MCDEVKLGRIEQRVDDLAVAFAAATSAMVHDHSCSDRRATRAMEIGALERRVGVLEALRLAVVASDVEALKAAGIRRWPIALGVMGVLTGAGSLLASILH